MSLTRRPEFVGGPWDGKTIDERFPLGHMLHGKLPSGIRVPTNPPPNPPGEMHEYEFIGGQYVYRRATHTETER